jgi:hypothetical protein
VVLVLKEGMKIATFVYDVQDFLFNSALVLGQRQTSLWNMSQPWQKKYPWKASHWLFPYVMQG